MADDTVTATSDANSPMRMAMAACTGVAAIANWMAANTTNKDAAREIHGYMLANLGVFPPGTDVSATYEAVMLRHFFGPGSPAKLPEPPK